ATLTASAAIQFVTNAAIPTGTVSAPVAALAQGVLTSMTFTKAKMTIAALLTAGRRTGEKVNPAPEEGRTHPNQKKKEKSDKELLQGTWVEESRGADAEKVAEGDRWKLVFDEDKVTWTVKGKDREGIFTVDAEQKPKEINLTLADPTLI